MADNSSFSGSDWLRFMANQPSSPISADAIKANAIGMGNTLHNTLGLFNRRGPLYKAVTDPKGYVESMHTPSAEEMAMAFNPAHLGAMAGTTKLYSGVNKAAAELTRAKGTGKEFMTELTKKPGVKKAELADRNLHEINDLPKMTKEQFQAELAKRPKPEITKKILGKDPISEHYYTMPQDPEGISDRHYVMDFNREPVTEYPFDTLADAENYIRGMQDESSNVHHMDWKLPGGENYQEHLYKYEPEGQEPFVANKNHFGGEPNILASARTVDRRTPEGKKILHVEEIQSDWHQRGRDEGYHEAGEEGKKHNEFEVYSKELAKKYGLNPNQNLAMYATMKGMDPSEVAKYEQLQNALIETKNRVPDAPFKKNWEEMVSKDLVKHAIDNGYDGIALTNGAEQADRYSLKHHIGEVYASPTEDGKFHLTVNKKNGDEFYDTARTGPININEIQNLVGKELAEKIASQEKEHTYSGLDLEVGGEGMKAAYDKRIPNAFNDIGKPHGAEMKLNAMPIPGKTNHYIDDVGDGTFHVRDVGDSPSKTEHDEIVSTHPTQEEAVAKMKELNSTPLHYMEFTPEMKQSVSTDSLPAYADGGQVAQPRHESFLNPSLRLANGQVTLNPLEFMPNYQRGGKVHVADDLDMMRHELETRSVRRFDEGGQEGRPYIGNPNIEAQGAKATAIAEARPSDITGKIQQFGNMLKDHYNRIVSDPAKYGEDLVNKAQSDLDEVHALHGQAFANPERPFQVTDTDALSKLSDKYMGSALGFAPAGITKIAGMKPIEVLFPGKTLDSLTSGEKSALTKYTKTLETPAVRRREEARLTGTGTIKQPSLQLIPKKGVDPQSLLNKYIVPVLWDTSETGNAISQIEGIPLTKGKRDPTPVVSETQGGTDYPRILENINQGIAGASMKSAAASKMANLNTFANKGDTVGMVFDMSPEGINFSHHIVEPYIGMLNYLNPSKSALTEFRDVIRNKPVESPPKSGNFIYPFKKFPGLDSPNIRDLIAEGTNEYTPGNLRKAIAETGNTAYFENMGFPRWEDIYKNVSRPNALTGMGSTIFSVKPNSNIMTPNFTHGSYNYGIPGVYEGSGLINAKGEIVGAPDYMMLQKEFAKRQALNKTIPNIRTSLFKAHHGEKFDQQALDNLMKYLGYKEGGKVNVSDDLNIMRQELNRG